MNPPVREVAKGAIKRLRLDSLQALALILVISISAVTILYAVSSEKPAPKPSPPVSPTGTSYSMKLTVSGSPSTNDDQNNSIRNGDFSNGLANWTAVKVINTGINGEFPIFAVVNNTSSNACVPIERRDNPSLRIEAPFGANGYVKQQITLPGPGTRLSFLSWGWEGFGPQFQYSGLVNAYVSIVDANGVVHTLETYTPPPMFIPGTGNTPDICTGNSPVLNSYDLSAFAGQRVELRLGVTSENCCGTDGFFDDVQVTTLSMAPEGSTFVITPSGSNGYCPCNSSNARPGIRTYSDSGLQRLIPSSVDVGEFHPGDQVVLYLWVTNIGNNATLSWSSSIGANATGVSDSWVWTNDGQTWRGLTGYGIGGVVATMYIIHISTLTPPGTYSWTLTLKES